MVKAAVLGAAGGIGQPLSLLCKISPLIDDLALYDVVNVPGVAADLSHIDTRATTKGYLNKEDGMEKTLTGCDIVIIPAGIPRKPGMTRDDLFKINAGIVKELITGCAKYCPKAFILIISNPVNSTVPIAAEILKQHGVFDPKRLFGVTSLDSVRASTFVAEVLGESDPEKVKVSVVGGHSGETIVPILSKFKLNEEQRKALVQRIQFGGDEVVKAKDGAGSATLSMAYAGWKFAESLLKAAKGEKGIVEPAYVYVPGLEGEVGSNEVFSHLEWFALPIELGPSGMVKALNPIKDADEQEKELLKVCCEQLQGNIKKGVEFVNAANTSK